MTLSADRAGRAPEPADRTYTIGELAAEFDMTPRSIRFYEDEGLLAPQRVGRNRVYDRRDRARLVLIGRGKRLGFSVAEIRQFLDLYEVDSDQVGQMTFAYRQARERIRLLEAQRRDLEETLAELRGMATDIAGHLRRRGVDPERL